MVHINSTYQTPGNQLVSDGFDFSGAIFYIHLYVNRGFDTHECRFGMIINNQ